MSLKTDKVIRYAVTSGHNLSAYRSLAHKLLISSCSLGIRIMLKWMQFHAKRFLLYETETRTTNLLIMVAWDIIKSIVTKLQVVVTEQSWLYFQQGQTIQIGYEAFRAYNSMRMEIKRPKRETEKQRCSTNRKISVI